jgi:tetratricopeptide (TPR) repeat protein
MHNLDFFKARAKLMEANYAFNSQADLNRTNQLLNEAINLSKDLEDSLRTIVLLQVSSRYNRMNNHLQALQYAFQAHEIASKIRSLNLQQSSHSLFEEIYRSLRNYNKALDYSLKNLQLLRLIEKPHISAIKHANVASLYFMLDLPVLGKFHMNEAFRLADSIKGSKKLYNEITGSIVSALTLSTHNDVLTDFLKKYRQHFFISPGNEFLDYVTLARAFAKTGNMDSAKVLIQKATEYFKPNERPDISRRYYYTLARIATHDKDWGIATENYKKALQVTLSMNNLNYGIDYTDSLNRILVEQKQFVEAVKYYKLGDSLQKEVATQLNKEEFTRQEVAALEKEKQIQALEKEKEKNQRHNVQYLGITFGVVALFIALLLMGIFKVSPRTIKILSFFSFLLFFEFIFLIFKKQIAVITNGEPWMDLAFMVLLAAVMVPLHHWGEHKVVEYLSTKKLLSGKQNFSGRKLFQKKKV